MSVQSDLSSHVNLSWKPFHQTLKLKSHKSLQHLTHWLIHLNAQAV